MSNAETIQEIIDNNYAKLKELSAISSPTVREGNKTIFVTEYRKRLLDEIKELQDLIATADPNNPVESVHIVR